jgi:23S rRNA pseudouridine1911/1915/1917 synthase
MIYSLSNQDILFEDNHLLVLNKRAGCIVQGAQPGDASLLESARTYIGEKYNKPGKVFLGVVSRLDRVVTGVVPFARTSKSAARLNAQFQGRSVEKIYWAMVQGRLEQPSGTLQHWLVRDENRMKTLCHPNERTNSSPAILKYRSLASAGDNVHWIEIALETGRKHQIRAQFEAIGCPILGDSKYASRATWPPESIALHCRKLVLQHPTLRTTLQWEARIPSAWLQFALAKELDLPR